MTVPPTAGPTALEADADPAAVDTCLTRDQLLSALDVAYDLGHPVGFGERPSNRIAGRGFMCVCGDKPTPAPAKRRAGGRAWLAGKGKREAAAAQQKRDGGGGSSRGQCDRRRGGPVHPRPKDRPADAAVHHPRAGKSAERQCLSHAGSGNRRQRRCLSHEDSENRRQRRCLSHEDSGNARQRRCLTQAARAGPEGPRTRWTQQSSSARPALPSRPGKRKPSARDAVPCEGDSEDG